MQIVATFSSSSSRSLHLSFSPHLPPRSLNRLLPPLLVFSSSHHLPSPLVLPPWLQHLPLSVSSVFSLSLPSPLCTRAVDLPNVSRVTTIRMPREFNQFFALTYIRARNFIQHLQREKIESAQLCRVHHLLLSHITRRHGCLSACLCTWYM